MCQFFNDIHTPRFRAVHVWRSMKKSQVKSGMGMYLVEWGYIGWYWDETMGFGDEIVI